MWVIPHSAFECFQKQIEVVLTGLKSAKYISDDILIWGESQVDHDQNLDKVGIRLRVKTRN